MRAKHAAKMNWKEVEGEFQAGILLVVPIGAGCKEHGLHLPNNTDQIQAEFFAEKIAETCNILIMPTINYNFYPSFMHYAGSTSLPSDHCIRGYVELCEQWNKQGARAIYFLNFGVSTNKPGVLVPQKPEPGSNDCYSPTGAWGDPSLATPEKGEIYVKKMMEFLLEDLAPHLIHQHGLTL